MNCYHCGATLREDGTKGPRHFDLTPVGLMPPISDSIVRTCDKCGHSTQTRETIPFSVDGDVRPQAGDVIRVTDGYGRVRRVFAFTGEVGQ